MASSKPKNLIPTHSLKKHYAKGGQWKMDKANPDGYEDVADYAKDNPQYVFQATEKPKDGQKWTNKYVGIHDPDFIKSLGASAVSFSKKGGVVVRVGERKVK